MIKLGLFGYSLLSSLFITSALAGMRYERTDEIIGRDFYNKFNFQAIPDPTHGRVNYTDKATAKRLNLTYATDDSFVLRTDFQTVLDPLGPGRDSVRIRTNKAYTSHVAVFDIRHMPQGCGTWPAVWETKESNWPNGGEIDVLEGVNDQGKNSITVHTSPNCVMPDVREQTGTNKQLDCDTQVNFNAGCGVTVEDSNSYGPNFNTVGGGWYAMERTEHFISGWFWPRSSNNVPQEVRYGARIISTAHWGIPSATFPDTTCDFPSHFQENNIIINLTLCGDWADAVYAQSGCPSTCVDFINNNPAALVNAYFDFASIRVYEPSRDDGPGNGGPGHGGPGHDGPGQGGPGNDGPGHGGPGNDGPGHGGPGNDGPGHGGPGYGGPGNGGPGNDGPGYGGPGNDGPGHSPGYGGHRRRKHHTH